jgi:poly(3-hydroxybutyrate) depolymerase/photosystem II stability/assembly factor-like uncharacterized protein
MRFLAGILLLAACGNDSQMGTPDALASDASPDSSTPCDDNAPHGALHAQTLTVSGETRYYFVYVPTTYSCAHAWPLLVDFHGTGAASTPDTAVEEYYAQDELVALAEQQGFIVARPRSRYANESGQLLFRWDENTGDLTKNVAFTRALVPALAAKWRIDPARTYTSGFSNGTNMAMQFFGDALFHGFAVIGGGEWNTPAHVPTDGARIYATTGYRDYMYQYLRQMRSFLDAHQYAADRMWQRETDTGHVLYGWHFAELWAWLDRGEKPAAGNLAAGWTRETLTPGAPSLIQLAKAQDGSMLAAGALGTLWRRDASGWQRTAQLTSGFAPNFTDLCVLANGHGVAIGEGVVAETSDDGAHWTVGAQVPEFGGMNFGFSYLNGLGCASGAIVGAGYWSAAKSSDGNSWAGVTMDEGSYAAQVAAVHVSDGGTWLASGYYSYLARSSDGSTFTESNAPVSREWWNGIASAAGGRWWVVGEAGGILASTDDAQTFLAQTAPRGDDLYAVAFYDAQHGMAVGAHGAALLTTNGGTTWQDVSTGLDGFLGDVAWLDAQTALVVGQGGTVLRYAAP